MPRFVNFISIGATLAALAVIMGAYGAHDPTGFIGEEFAGTFQKAVRYHTIHAVGLILVGLLQHHHVKSRWLKMAGLFLFTGIILFSGSLYAIALTGERFLGWTTPLGGLCFIIGWLCLAWAGSKIALKTDK